MLPRFSSSSVAEYFAQNLAGLPPLHVSYEHGNLAGMGMVNSQSSYRILRNHVQKDDTSGYPLDFGDSGLNKLHDVVGGNAALLSQYDIRPRTFIPVPVRS